jgi:molybdenum cofactor biosynthesis enzyme MoaA
MLLVKPQTLLLVPNKDKCNAGCKFCVTKILGEGSIETIVPRKFDRVKLERVMTFAKNIGVKDVNITGGGEPLLSNRKTLKTMMNLASNNFGRVMLYTNAGVMSVMDIEDYVKNGLTNVTISRAHNDNAINRDLMNIDYRWYDFYEIVDTLIDKGVDVKLSCLLYKKGVDIPGKVWNYIEWAKSIGVTKVIFRELLDKSDPNYVPSSMLKELMGDQVISGIWDQRIVVWKGMAITAYDDGSRFNTVNHGDLVFMPDNNLYTSWNYKASRIM